MPDPVAAAPTLTVKEFKATFFNDKAVTDKVEAAKLKVHAKGGALTRVIAQRSMRRRSKNRWRESSPAGQPPNADRGQIRDLLFFAYDRATESTVVGPAFFPSKASAAGGATVPGVHEQGGALTRFKKVFDKRPKAASREQAAAFRRKVKDGSIVPKPRTFQLVRESANYPKRPFMVPALDKAKAKLADFFRNSV